MTFPVEKIDLDSASLYLHFPFCRSKCDYCAFLSYPNQTLPEIENQLDITATIAEEIFKQFSSLNLTSIYFGGGTPSLVPIDTLKSFCERIFSLPFSSSFASFYEKIRGSQIEWTMEANCRDISKENLAGWASIGINRISLGIQSLRQEVLDEVGRETTSDQQQEALKLMSDYWGKELNLRWSIDLIAGLPGYTNKMFITDLKELTLPKKFNFGHISIYDLILEEGTPLFNRINHSTHKELDDNHQDNSSDMADLWDDIKALLSKRGFSRYEISNFAKQGEESIHNRQYWDMKPYVGLGEGAVSMLPLKQADPKDFNSKDRFVFRMTQKSGGLFDLEEISNDTYKKEFLMMGLRDRRGVDRRRFKEIFGEDIDILISETISRYFGFFILEDSPGSRLALCEKGRDILNSILISIFEELD